MKNITIKKNVTIKKAMEILSKEGRKCLIVIDGKKKLLGTISDGDIRKALLGGYKISDLIINVFNTNPKYLIENQYNYDEIENLFIKNR